MASSLKPFLFKILSRFAITLACFWVGFCQTSLYGQETEMPPYHHWSLESGLPSNEIYHIIESRRGNIWIATDNGVAKYDGKEFIFFGKKDGLTDNVVFKLFEDDKGIIWCTTYNNKICKILPNDSIVPYEWNDTLEKAIPKHLSSSMLPISLAVSNDSLAIGYRSKGGIILAPDGTYKLLNKEKRKYTIRKFGKYSIQFSTPEHNLIQFKLTTIPLIKLSGLRNSILNYGYSCRLNNGYLVGTFGNVAFIENETKGIDTLYFPEPITYTKQIDDLLWFGMLNNGAQAYQKKNGKWIKKHHFFQGSSVSTILKDRNYGYWFATHESGIYYVTDFSYRSATICNQINNIYDVEILGDNVYVIDSEQDIEVYNKQDLSLIKRIDTPFVASSFFNIDKSYGDCYLGIFMSNSNLFLVNDKTISTLELPEATIFFKRFISENKSLDITSDEKITVHNHLSGKKFTLNGDFGTSNVFIFNDHIFTTGGASCGIYTITGDSVQFETRDLLNEQIQQIKTYPSGTYCCSKSGCIYKLNVSTLSFEKIYCLDGLNLLDFEIDGEQIWLATSIGLLKTKGNKTEKYWEESVKFVSVSKGMVLFATSKRLITFRDYNRSDNSAVYISSYAVNGLNTTKTDLETGENNLSFNLGIKFPIPEKEYKIQAVLIGSDTITSDLYGNIISYPQLSSGSYQFYFKNLSNGSQSEVLHFTISPPFWQQWWFVVGVISFIIIVGLIIITAVYRRREKRTLLEGQLIELRSKALRAQMNPHFIFNVMNVIQSLISSKKLDESSDVLVKLSKLIRNALNYSKHEIITLTQELSFCEDYFRLENMRVKNQMQFKLDIAPTIDPDKVIVPPLTIQPILENAIVHGLIPLEGKGEIGIEIKDNDKTIQISITDTGVGYNPTPSSAKHESHGVNMVSDRITILDKRNSILIKKKEQKTGTVVIITLYKQ